MKRFFLSAVCLLCFVVSSQAGRVPHGTTVSTSGSTAAGTRHIIMVFSSDFVGTVLGVSVTGADQMLEFGPLPLGDTIDAIAYTRSAGSIRIWYIQ